MVTVTATDAEGNESAPTAAIIDATAPVTPVVDLANGSEVSGTAEPGSTVEVTVGGEVLTTTASDPDGVWSVSPVAPDTFDTGEMITVTATDAEGNESVPTDAIVDATAPEAPVVDIANGTEISGTAEANATIEVDVDGDGNSDHSATADESGNWSVAPSPELSDGTMVSVTATDSEENTSSPTDVTVDATAPAVPVIDIANATEISGTSEANATVEVDVDGDGNSDFTTTADESGNWSVAPAPELADGVLVSVTATDADANTSDLATATVDAIAPAAPVIEIANATEISGTAEANATIEVDVGGDGNSDFTATADELGNWSVIPSPDLADGTLVSVTATDSENNTSDPAAVIVDAIAPAAPVIDIASGIEISGIAEANATVEVDVDGDSVSDYTAIADAAGNWTVAPSLPLTDGTAVSATAIDSEGNSSVSTTEVTDAIAPAAPVIDIASGTEIRGTAEANATVEIDVDGDFITDYSATADATGNWSVTPFPELTDGIVVSATATDSENNTSEPVTATVDAIAPATPVIAIANGTEIRGTAEANSTVEIDVDGDFFADFTAIADESGNWSIAPSPQLFDGTMVSVTAIDADGNTSDPATATVDAIAPAAPAIDIANATEISGTAEANAMVEVDVDGDLVGDYTAIADASGNWTIATSLPLTDGTIVSAAAIDSEGNTSEPATATVDAIAPAAPVIDIANGIEISGSAEPGSNVEINIGGEVQSVTADPVTGAFVVAPIAPDTFDTGEAVSVTATDSQRNTLSLIHI